MGYTFQKQGWNVHLSTWYWQRFFWKNHEVQLSSCKVTPIVGVDVFINEIHS